MKKLAVFVEGQTEQIFVEKLLLEIAGQSKISIESRKAVGGANGSRRTTHLARPAIGDKAACQFFVMIVDCGTDSRVASDVKDNYDSLVRGGYSAIIAIRDVYPIPRNDIPTLRRNLCHRLPTVPIAATFVLGIMEIESWFLAEASHFPRVHASLTLATLVPTLGFNPATDDMQLRPNPAVDLHSIYSRVGLAYGKSRKQIQRTVDVLDYAEVYLSTKQRFPDLAALVASIDGFLAQV